VVECVDCRFENRPDALFCGGCGARLPVTRPCPSCATENPTTYSFCYGCGAHLDDESKQRTPSGKEAAPATDAEHRQLTVLFCDLVGSTKLSTELETEELRELMKSYHAAAAQEVERFEGHVAQYLGDGVLVYFGYPTAHEDDAVRAVRAAVDIITVMSKLEDQLRSHITALPEHPLAVRIGIHTGPVVVGETGGGASREWLAIGRTVNVAARLQALAPSDSIVVGDTTRRLVERSFVLESLGAQVVRGLDEALELHRVVRPKGVGTPDSSEDETGLTPFVGRDQELAFLLERWEHAADGLGQAVLLEGDAGIGKSRLLRRLHHRLTDRDHTWLEARGSAYHTNSAFHPVIDLIQRAIEIDHQDPLPLRGEKLERALRAAGLPVADVYPLFATLLSLPVPDHYTLTVQSAEARRLRTLEALVAWIFALAERRPVVLAVEDVHWIDPSTSELLNLLVEQARTARTLIVMTTRPTVRLGGSHRTHITSMTLDPLTRSQTHTMLSGLIGERTLPESIVRQLVAKCDGVPLYAEELTKAVLESTPVQTGNGSTPSLEGSVAREIPTTLRDSLMARLDRLGPAKELAQLASVLGREFHHDLLAAIVPMSATDLAAAVDALEEAELLYRRGVPPRATYTFKHTLIQETAYASLLRSRRIELHARVARVLEEEFPDVALNEPEIVAYHYGQARRHEHAVAYYFRAGLLAKKRIANAEAVDHLDQAIALLAETPESDERNRVELRMQVAIGAPLIITRGYAHESVRHAFERAHELCSRVADATELFEAVYGLSTYYLNRGEMARAHELSQRLIELADRTPGPSRRPWAHQQLGCVHYFGGNPQGAREQFDLAVATYDDPGQRGLIHIFGQDPAVASMVLCGMARWLLGHPDDGLATSRAAVERGREVNHPFSLAFALCFCAYNHVQRREREPVVELAAEAERLAREEAVDQWIPPAVSLKGWAMPDPAEGIAIMEAAMIEASQKWSRIGSPFHLSMLIDRLIEAGRIDDAIASVKLALDLANETSNHFCDAEIHRLRGDLELRRAGGTVEEAEAFYRRAVEIARAQKARSLELRSAVSLARLLADRDGPHVARDMVAPLYESFDDGLASPDVTDARTLLADLG
jgi:class 3 adenylate cyclase/tetratricopeptide (TPR) repeat protein